MKNYAKYLLLFALISFETSIYNAAYNAVQKLPIGYLHNKILEETVPEFKEFNTKLRALFVIKDNVEKIRATRALLNFVDETRKKLNYEIQTKKMTPAELKAIKIVLSEMNRKTNKLEQMRLA